MDWLYTKFSFIFISCSLMCPANKLTESEHITYDGELKSDLSWNLPKRLHAVTLSLHHHVGSLTFSSALFRFFSCSGGVRSRRTSQASFSRGMTLRKISVAMKSEQMGSAINQPNWRMRMVEMITPTLPKVSARTWRKTPERKKKKTWALHLAMASLRLLSPRALPQTHTSHVSIHASTPRAVGVTMSAVSMSTMSPVSVTSMRVAMTSMAVLAVGVAMVRVAMVVWWTAFAAMGVSVTKSADTHQVDQQSSNRHRLQETKIRTWSSDWPMSTDSMKDHWWLIANISFLKIVPCKLVSTESIWRICSCAIQNLL